VKYRLIWKSPNNDSGRVFNWHGWGDEVSFGGYHREHRKARLAGYRSYSAYRMAKAESSTSQRVVSFGNRLTA